MKNTRLTFALLVAAALLLWWLWWGSPPAFQVFDGVRTGCAIIVPQDATRQEMTAAQLLSETLATAAGRETVHFPVRKESWWRFWAEGVFVGETKHAKDLPLPGTTKLERPVGVGAFSRGIVIRSRWREDVVGAASWFLEKHLSARWYLPGPLGASVPRRDSLQLSLGIEIFTPSFVSRSLGLGGANGEERWAAANRLQAIFQHHHSMSGLFKPEDIAQKPELAPLINWQKYAPTRPDEQEWQPNIAAAAAAPHAAGVLRRRFNADPGLLSASIAMNDSIRYDQSPATQALVGPPRYFRQKPDFSGLVFAFANKVAHELASEFPDRFVTTYAYDWTENVPAFRLAPNLVPYLTADRSQWFDPAFAAQDKDLIKRWVAAGSTVVGIYDYYEGAPHLVPRPTLYAVTQSIPYACEAGVRAFYAEAYANWGLDGPKHWLAAQLLWDAKQDPAALLDTYYREFWQEAAGPMREFHELCDKQWLEQPLPSYWLKYFKDEHQALCFPADVRLALRLKLETAGRLARSDTVRRRLEFVSAAFAVTEAFCEFNEARDRLSRLALAAALDPGAVVAAAGTMGLARGRLDGVLGHTKAKHPLAITARLLDEYTRNDPRRRALWRLLRENPATASSADFAGAFVRPAAGPTGGRRQGTGRRWRVDPADFA